MTKTMDAISKKLSDWLIPFIITKNKARQIAISQKMRLTNGILVLKTSTIASEKERVIMMSLTLFQIELFGTLLAKNMEKAKIDR